jgi:hypothetical protein
MLWRSCLRRKVYNLIENKLYNDAKNLLNRILDEEPNNDFAKGELEYIEKVIWMRNK